MVSSLARAGWLRPWRVAAVLLALFAALLVPAGRAEAAIGLTFTLNDTTASANTDATGTINLEADLNPTDTIILTFPAGWNVSDGALTGFDTGGGSGFVVPPTVTGSNAARTVTFTLNAPQPSLAPINLTLTPSAEIINAPNGTNVTVLVDTSTAQAQGASAPFTITAAAITGGAVTLTSFVAGAQTAGTIAFTLPAALANGNSIVLTFPAGWTVANGAMTATNWQGLDGAVPTSVTGNAAARTVTIVVSAAQNTLVETLTIVASAELVNPTTAAAGLTINVAATGQTAGNTNAFAIVAGTPTAAQSTVARAPASVAADNVTTSTITVTLRDVNNNPAAGKTVTLGQGGGSSTISAASGPSDAGGVVTFTVRNAVAEVVTYTATDTTDAVVVTQTAAVTFTAGTPTAGASLVAAAPGSVVADGATTSTITVTLRDGSNNPIAGKTVTLAQGGGASTISAASGPSSGAGVVTFTVTNTTAQVVTYTATDTTDGVVVTQTAAVTFTAGTPTAGNSTVVASPTTVDADGTSASTITVTLRDVNSNGVSGKTVTLAQGAGSSTISAASGASSGAGVVTFTVTATTAQAVTYTATDTTDAVVVTQTAAVSFVTPTPPANDDPGTGGGGPPMFFPVTCQPGSYNEGGNCVSASPGHFVQSSGASSQVACAAGFYQPNYGATFCFQVPAGSFTSTTGATSAITWTVCPTGQVEVMPGTATTDRVCGQSPRPKVTALALVPLNASGAMDVNLPFSDWPRADLTGGQTTFTLTVVSGRSYGVAAQADSGEITFRRNGSSFDPASTRLAAGDTVTIVATSDAGTSPTYTVTLGSAVVCLNGGFATNGTCVCPTGFTGTQCQIATALRLTALSLVPQQAGYDRITVPVVDGQTVYEVDVVAYKQDEQAPRYNLSATMSDPAAQVKVSAFGLQWDPTGVSFQSGESGTFTATGSSGTSPTYTVQLRAPAAPLTNAAVTLSSTLPGATGVTHTVTFVTPAAIPAGGKIKVTLTGFTWPATPSAQFTAPVPTAAPASTAFASNVLTITNSAGVIPAGTVTLRVTGGTNPAAQAARSDVAMSVTNSADTVLASTSTGTMVAIAAPETAVTAVTISANPRVAEASTTITVEARYTTALVAADQITVKLNGYTLPVGPIEVTAGTGITGTLVGNVAAGATDTVVLRGGAVAAGSSATFTFPATNPAAGSIAATGLTVKTSKDTTEVSSSSGFTITAPPAPVVTLRGASVLAPNDTLSLVADVTGAGTGTPTYAWSAAGANGERCWGTDTPIASQTSSSISLSLPTEAAGSTCVFSVTVTVGSQQASASIRVVVSERAVARLEFVTQPKDSTTGSADIIVQVSPVKADGTLDANFRGLVRLTVEGGGRSLGLGSKSTPGAVATFVRTWNAPSEGPWVLKATAPGYEAATSNEFRVTRPPTLRFTTQPVGGTAGAALSTQPVVTAYRADGAVDTSFTGSVSLTLKADTANNAVLTSTATAAVAGRATFTGTSINNAGTGYVLVASATGYADVASAAFNVTNAATKIVITQYPSAFVAGQDRIIEVRAEARDAEDRIVPGAASRLGLLVNNDTRASDRDTLRIAIEPTSVEDGVAVFRMTYRFDRGGQYRWGIDVIFGASIPQADSETFTVAKPAAKLVFVQQPGGFGSVLGTQPIVEIQDEDGNRIPGATNEVTLTFLATNDTDPIMTGGARRAATAGRVTYTGVGFTGGTARPGDSFTLTAASTGLTSATSASFGPAGPTTKLAFTSDLPCGVVARPGCSPAAREGQSFTITVWAQDAAGRINPNEDGVATLTGDGNTGMTAKTASFIQGVATFTGVSFTSASTTGYTLTASLGALQVASGRIVVTQDNTPASLRFTRAPAVEVSAVVFGAQPEVRVYNAAGREITTATGSVVLTLGKQDGTTTSLLGGTTSVALSSGVARFRDIKVTGADTNLYLTATLGSLTATQTGTFPVYGTTTELAVAQGQRQTFSLALNIASSDTSSLKSGICNALSLVAASCARISVTSVASSSVVMIGEDGRVLAVANVEVVDGQEIVTIGGLNLRTFEAETGATAPAGTSALYAAARIAVDAYGNRLVALSAPRSFSLPVPESAVLLGTRPGDLRVAWWDGERWAQVPTRAMVNPDGSFTVTATTDALGAFAVLYAPGAGRIEGPGVFSADGAGFGVFAGGSTDTLAHAAGLNDATGAWVQDAAGAYRLLVVGGPAFLRTEFASRFPDGIRPSTAVTLVRPAAASASADASSAVTATSTVATVAAPVSTSTGGTYTVTAADTLSGIGARFGVDQQRLAAANGIVGPNYVVRTGQVLTIPAAGASITYTVTAADTLSGMGVRFGVGWTRIAEANGIVGPNYVVRTGQVLTIPR